MTLEMAIIYIKHTEEEGVLRGLVVALCAQHIHFQSNQTKNSMRITDTTFSFCVYNMLKTLGFTATTAQTCRLEVTMQFATQRFQVDQ